MSTRVDRPGIPAQATPGAPSWIGAVRGRAQRDLPYDKLLPETQPAYVASWVYTFGVLSLTALAVVVGSGVVLTLRGPAWYHVSGVGHWFNSLHFWSVQLFFLFMLAHFAVKFFMAAWRGNRGRTWVTGVLSFLLAIMTGLTGYVIQTNFDSQWISFEAKDGLNAVGIGAWFDVTNLGQMTLVHVALLPLVVGVLVVVHVLLVRLHGVVPPIDAAFVEDEHDLPAGREERTAEHHAEQGAQR